MIVQLFMETTPTEDETAAAKPAIRTEPMPPTSSAPIRHHTFDRCNALRSGVRTLLRLAVEGAFDLWQGKPTSAHLARFDLVFEEQRRAMGSMCITGGEADYSFLIRKAQAALDAFGRTVSNDIAGGVERGMDELAFYEQLNRAKESAIRAADCIGRIQVAAG